MNTITDDQIAEIEALANDASPFDWSPDIGMTHAETVYACSVGPDSILALITRLREAERDAARYRWLREQGFSFSHDAGFAGISITKWGPSWMYDEKQGFADLADAAIDAAVQESEQ